MMPKEHQWEEVRRQVALWGRVIDPEGKAVGRACVCITNGPEDFKRRMQPTSQCGTEEPIPAVVTEARSDGIYYFLDLPAGSYELTACDPQGKRQGQGKGNVAWDGESENRKVERVFVNIELAVKKPKQLTKSKQ